MEDLNARAFRMEGRAFFTRMAIYQYDGTPEGLFSAFETAARAGAVPEGFSAGAGGALDLFTRTVSVMTDPALAAAFVRRLQRVDKRLPGEVIRGFLSEMAGVEVLLYQYALTLACSGAAAKANRTDPVIEKTQRVLRKVGSETHRLKGLLRFEELADGLLWASCEPAFNVTPLLVPHFMARLKHYRWMICDVRRGTAMYYDRAKIQAVELEDHVLASLRTRGQLPGRTAESDSYVDLWRTFFKSVAIEARKNPELQRQCMPQRFWKWLPEKM
ncbi:MAG: TIGR03915 family putative DNA repair protein [Lentisphaeria bacterium]|nr:TIGR03915 family putative DNA repair protein [Lentisphaeria bacterium]